MVPRLAALSIAEISTLSCAASPLEVDLLRFFKLRNWVSTLRLRRERVAVWRARLEADLVLAMKCSNVAGREARGANRCCQEARATGALLISAHSDGQGRPAVLPPDPRSKPA